jgi:hypothetical protein
VNANADALIARLRGGILEQCRYPVRAVLLMGSQAEGFANEASDIDLIGITDNRGRRLRTREHPVECAGRPGSIIYVTEKSLRRRLASLDALYQAGGHLTDGLVTRLADARVVHDPEGIGATLVSLAGEYRPSPETLREMVRISLGFLHDALGSRGAGDHATAVLMARAAASVAVDCFLLDRNERNLKPKWHLRRLQRAGANEIIEPYLRVLGLDRAEPDDATRAVEEAQRLLCAVLRVPDLRNHAASGLFADANGAAWDRREEARP